MKVQLICSGYNHGHVLSFGLEGLGPIRPIETPRLFLCFDHSLTSVVKDKNNVNSFFKKNISAKNYCRLKLHTSLFLDQIEKRLKFRKNSTYLGRRQMEAPNSADF